ncbi:hypothetical protein C7476_105238 [Phyllobacterium bourgognense]|uniref:Uncharacterized protein n=1 Tax=Phyllobacterium bourgognense TaxID=314236 RepID=A0A368YU89_9HYPH|nr:hypothetical protein C7476_105238 [Phyllobacterium bourgognense]
MNEYRKLIMPFTIGMRRPAVQRSTLHRQNSVHNGPLPSLTDVPLLESTFREDFYPMGSDCAWPHIARSKI